MDEPDAEVRSPWTCDICRKEMPFGEIERHKKEAHREYLELQREKSRESGRAFLRMGIPAWAVISAAALVLLQLAPEHALYWVIATMFLLVLSIFYALWRSADVMRPVEDALREVERECDVCGERIKNKDWLEHTRALHPEVGRMMARGVVLMAAVTVAITGGACFVLAVYTRVLDDIGGYYIVFLCGVGAAVLSILVVGLCWAPREDAKIRKAWKESRGNPHASLRPEQTRNRP
ncbi:MAG: hypothetical protein JW880_03700 [Candidatus Thermoplasmatota archaeon]|nr:hypothetical protein [Candidatus Thermoplasmatota archaeon]